MPHERIRKFNTKEMYPEQQLDNDLCMAVRAGNRVFLRGQTGLDFEGNVVGLNDPGAQAENAMKCVKLLLEEAGAKLEHICKITVYITDRTYREPVYKVIGNWLKGILSLLDRADRERARPPGAADGDRRRSHYPGRDEAA